MIYGLTNLHFLKLEIAQPFSQNSRWARILHTLPNLIILFTELPPNTFQPTRHSNLLQQ